MDWLATNKEAALKLAELSMHMKVVESLLNTIKVLFVGFFRYCSHFFVQSSPQNPKFKAVLEPALANALQCIKHIYKNLDKAGKATKGYFPFFVSPDSAIKQVQADSMLLERVVRAWLYYRCVIDCCCVVLLVRCAF